MPKLPPRPCRVCRRLNCADPAHKPVVRGVNPGRPRGYSGKARKLRDEIMRCHVAEYGWWCPGAPELKHRAHDVAPGTLDLDHIDGDHSNNDAANLRVLCRRVNRGRRTS